MKIWLLNSFAAKIQIKGKIYRRIQIRNQGGSIYVAPPKIFESNIPILGGHIQPLKPGSEKDDLPQRVGKVLEKSPLS